MTDQPTWKHELPGFPHKLFDAALKIVFEFYTEHIDRDIKSGRLRPTNYWVLNRGLLVGAMQTYAAICLLLSEKRPKPLRLQANILNRTLFEALVNIMCLVEDPARTSLLEREAFRSLALRYRDYDSQYGSVDKWCEYLDVYRQNLELSS